MTAVKDGFDEPVTRYPAATLYEAAGRSGALPDRIRPLWTGARVWGPAFSVRTAARDNLRIHRAIYEAAPGDVLVVSCAAEPACGYWGELMTRAAQERRLAGLVIDGGVRDVEAIVDLEFPVFRSRVSIRGTDKRLAGRGGLGERVVLEGEPIEPGDLIVGDADGVVVVARDRVAAALEAAAARERAEEAVRERIAAGERLVDIITDP
ncbi:MAG: RraA family protein [Gemmatimonadota bacterium]